MLVMDLRNRVERSIDVDEKIPCTIVQREVNVRTLYYKEGKEMTKIFQVKIQVKKMMVDAIFDSFSQVDVVVEDNVSKHGLRIHDHPCTYSLGWINKDVNIRVINQCNIIFFISAYYIDEL